MTRFSSLSRRPRIVVAFDGQDPYCSSLTFSSQSADLPSSSSTIAIWVIAVVAAAPCQCFSPGGNQTTSPGRISSFGSAPALRPAETGGDDQRLAKRMGVPRGAGAGLEGDAGAEAARRFGRLKQRVDANGAGEVFGRSFSGGPGAVSFDFHCHDPFLSGVFLLIAHSSVHRPSGRPSSTPLRAAVRP